jgi:hypothetical protein
MVGFLRNLCDRIASIRVSFVCLILAFVTTVFPFRAAAQDWAWDNEVVDTSGKGMSLAVDEGGNVHISYGADKEGLKYGFRPAGAASRWFTLALGGGVNYTHLALDRHGNAHICSTYLSLPLRYAYYDGKQWDIQEIVPEDRTSVQVACGVAISADGTPHLSWYRIPLGGTYAHIRYAFLRDGVWLMRTLDFDMQTGKWHSMELDAQGKPCISYDAFVKGLLKFARWDGKEWNIRVVDSRGAHGSDYSLGMGSSLAFDSRGNTHISYYSDTEMRHAWQEGEQWKVETVDKISPTGSALDYRSSLVLDVDGFAHISYEDSGVLKHAYFDGKQWNVQVVAPTGNSRSRFNAMTIDRKQNILYLAYKNAGDGSLRVAVGHKVAQSRTAIDEKKSEKN